MIDIATSDFVSSQFCLYYRDIYTHLADDIHNLQARSGALSWRIDSLDPF